jgi:hypothetical protein
VYSSKIQNSFPEHDRRTVADEGLSGRKNGELLRLAEVSGFSVFISVDRGLEYEQNLRTKTIAVILIRATSSRLQDLLPHVPEIQRVLAPGPKLGLIKVG